MRAQGPQVGVHRARQPGFEQLHAVTVEEEPTGGAPPRPAFKVAIVADGPALPAGLVDRLLCVFWLNVHWPAPAALQLADCGGAVRTGAAEHRYAAIAIDHTP